MRVPRFAALTLAIAAVTTLAACGKKDADDAADTTAQEDTAAAAAAETASAQQQQAAAQPQNAATAPLSVADIDRWKKGMDAELKAVKDASAKVRSARTGTDTLQAMSDAMETSTREVGAKAAGVDPERYGFIRSTFEATVGQLTPPEQEGMDTASFTKEMRDQFRQGREAALQRVAPSLEAGVIDALKPRAVELRKQSMTLAFSRVAAAEGK
jgi:hypothetical protein